MSNFGFLDFFNFESGGIDRAPICNGVANCPFCGYETHANRIQDGNSDTCAHYSSGDNEGNMVFDKDIHRWDHLWENGSPHHQ